MFDNLSKKDIETIYNSLNNRWMYMQNEINKNIKLNNKWHQEELKRCEDLMIQIEPLVYSEDVLNFVKAERISTGKFFSEEI